MKIIIVVTGTVLILLFSWFFSIKHKRYHGIARFFSFESIMLLVLLNFRIWFSEPFSWHQVISWIFLFSSVWFAVLGFLLLREIGKPQGGNLENTSVLVRKGLYKYIRHPLYLSLILLGTGIMMKQLHTVQIVLGLVNLTSLYMTARIEEKEMIARFGEEYKVYMNETKMFIPFLL